MDKGINGMSSDINNTSYTLSSNIPLYAHTLDSLCDELISGRTIPIESARTFRLKTIESRAIFNWYYKNRHKWSGLNKKEDVEAIVDYLKIMPPEKAANKNVFSKKEKKQLHLKKVHIHRFAGIHKYGNEQECPEDFGHEFEKPITLIEGDNGSGKTSFANAIVWGLTGHIYRSQRLPEKIEEINITAYNMNQEEILKTCTAITPIPEASLLLGLKEDNLLLDTWVELTFEDDNGVKIATVKRSISRTPRGKLQIDVDGIDKLGLDPVAIEVGTKMAGLIPYIQIGEASDIGKAIASLTGLKPLEDMVKHAKKSQDKLKGEMKNIKEGEIESADTKFNEIKMQLTRLIESTPSLTFKIDGFANLADGNNNFLLRKAIKTIKKIEADELLNCKEILGDNFNPDNTETIKDLIANVGKALGLLDKEALKQLPSISRLNQIRKVTPSEIEKADSLINRIVLEANEIEELEKKPDFANRERLYACIGAWIRQNNQSTKICPICQQDLGDQKDKITNKRIADHLEQHTKEDKEYLAKIIQEWAKSWKDKLLSELSQTLALEIRTVLPARPVDLISAGFGEELFKSNVFKNSLSPLKGKTKALCKTASDEMPPFTERPKLNFSPYFIHECNELYLILEKLNRAIGFVEWRSKNDEACKTSYLKIIGDSSVNEDSLKNNSHSLYFYLKSLNQLVNNTSPLREIKLKLVALRSSLKNRRQAERALKYYKKAVTALGEIIRIEVLVDLQVNSLITKLSDKIKKWKDKFYSPAYIGVPELTNTNIGPNGSLIVDAEIGKTKTSSKHICNSSDLRATLLAILFSLWEHTMEDRGGLSLIILDDLQEFFDKPNRERIANSLQDIINKGSRLLVTTNDAVFGRQVASPCPKGSLDRRQIHPIKTIRPHIVLGVFREIIEEKRLEYKKPENENIHQPARDYIKELRIYIENLIEDFYDCICPSLPPKPTLSDLLNGLRKWRSSGQEPFTEQAFSSLLEAPALQKNSQFLQLINKSHHGDANDIKFADVAKNESDCALAHALVESAHEAYMRWMRRVPSPRVSMKPEIPESVTTLKFNIPLHYCPVKN